MTHPWLLARLLHAPLAYYLNVAQILYPQLYQHPLIWLSIILCLILWCSSLSWILQWCRWLRCCVRLESMLSVEVDTWFDQRDQKMTPPYISLKLGRVGSWFCNYAGEQTTVCYERYRNLKSQNLKFPYLVIFRESLGIPSLLYLPLRKIRDLISLLP